MRQRILHVGLTPPNDPKIFHCPLITVFPRKFSENEIKKMSDHLKETTHFLFTSKTAIHILSLCVDLRAHFGKQCISVGQATTNALRKYGFQQILTAQRECAEGVVDLIQNQKNSDCFYFWGHAAKARPLITKSLQNLALPYAEYILYETKPRKPKIVPDLEHFEEIIFTSPSCVDAFVQIYGLIPKNKILTTQGEITLERLEWVKKNSYRYKKL